MADDRTTIRQGVEGTSTTVDNVKVQLSKLKSGGTLTQADNKQLISMVKELHKMNEYMELDKNQRKLIQKQLKEYNKETLKNWAKSFTDSEKNFERLQSALSSAFSQIDNHIKTYTQYAISVNSALQGTQKTYQEAVDNLTTAIGGTGLADMSKVLENMNTLTSQGLVANVEEHAFLESIKDGISSVFSSANGTLIRLIKLQGEDSTVNRLVMQASLKEYLNQTYQNSQYLYQQFDTVSSNLLEATSLLSSTLSNSLEATVQKWMGSLSSIGLSDSAVNSISSALGAVGSGNLRGMNENTQNLVIMGANRANLSYSDLLTGGLSAEDTDKLMYGIIDYLGSLQGNNVVLSEYANLFGMNVSDLVAARNAIDQLDSIQSTVISSDRSSLSRYLDLYDQYLNASPAALYDNLFNNLLFRMGANVAGDRDSYSLYKAGGLVGNIIGGIGLTGTVGNIANLIGPGMQLAAALGGGEGDLSLTNVGKTVSGLGESFRNLFDDPNSLLAYNRLVGSNLSVGSGFISDVAGNVAAQRTTKNASEQGSTATRETAARASVSKSASKNAFEQGSTTTIDLSETWSAIEEAEAARTIDDIYEFLSDDVVTVTPYIGETDILGTISSYNRQTAENTHKILIFMEKYLQPYLLFESMPETSSLLEAAEENSSLRTLLNTWQSNYNL